MSPILEIPENVYVVPFATGSLQNFTPYFRSNRRHPSLVYAENCN